LAAGVTEGADTLKCLDVFRQKAGYYYRHQLQERLWQEGFFDHVLREPDATFDVVSYIVANPVRAGICAEPSAYAFSGSSKYSIDEISSSGQWRPDALG
jgi:hypothetical protein